MRWDDTTTPQFRAALARLLAGEPVVIWSVGYLPRADGRLDVAAFWTSHPHDVTESLARSAIAHAQLLYEHLYDASEEARMVLRGRRVRFPLLWDSGAGAVEIC